MLENGLIRKTKTGKLYNISFKFDTETYSGKYKGSGFSGKIKLSGLRRPGDGRVYLRVRAE